MWRWSELNPDEIANRYQAESNGENKLGIGVHSNHLLSIAIILTARIAKED